jgi:HAD superfamily hydrolase (TIGR01490 family)
MKLAIFDFDGTVLRGNSWHLFFRQQLAAQPWRAPGLLAALALRRTRLVSAEWLQDQVLKSWRNRSRAEVAELSRNFYRSVLRPRLRSAALAEIARRRSEGFEIVLVSAAWMPLLEPFVEEQEITHWSGTPVDFVADRCIGRLVRPLRRGEAKRAWVQNTFADQAVDWSQSCAFGDEAFDLPLLALVGEPIFVGSSGAMPPGLPERTRLVNWA